MGIRIRNTTGDLLSVTFGGDSGGSARRADGCKSWMLVVKALVSHSHDFTFALILSLGLEHNCSHGRIHNIDIPSSNPIEGNVFLDLTDETDFIKLGYYGEILWLQPSPQVASLWDKVGNIHVEAISDALCKSP
jgi:hypothetical protein